MRRFAKACAITAAVAILGFAGNAVAQSGEDPEEAEEEAQGRPNPEEVESSNPALKDLERKGFNPQPFPPDKGAETMRKPDPTLNSQKLDTLKNSPNMKNMGR